MVFQLGVRFIGNGGGQYFMADFFCFFRKNNGELSAPRDESDSIHRALLVGLLSNVAVRGDGNEYLGGGGKKLVLWPGSSLFSKKPQWVIGAEVLETSRRYLRTVARIQPRWIEPLAAHLVKPVKYRL